MTAPDIVQSTMDERRAFVQAQWQCMGNCELCGKCRILKGRDPETLYADYIDGKCSYIDVTLGLRNNNR